MTKTSSMSLNDKNLISIKSIVKRDVFYNYSYDKKEEWNTIPLFCYLINFVSWKIKLIF